MKNCLNCIYLFRREIDICAIGWRYIPHPFFMGGKKCPCYEKQKLIKKKIKFEYPQKKS